MQKLNLNKRTKKTNLNLNQLSSLRTAHVFAYYCAQLSYAAQHGTFMIIFPLKLQTIIAAQTMYTGGEKEDKLKDWLHHPWWSYRVWHNNTTSDKLLITMSLYKII